MSDFSEVAQLAADLAAAGETILARVEPVVSKGGHNVMTAARSSASGLRHAPAYPRSITYDIERGTGFVAAETGPDKGMRQGALGNLIEFGSVNNPPHGNLARAAADEAPRFEEYIADIAGAVL